MQDACGRGRCHPAHEANQPYCSLWQKELQTLTQRLPRTQPKAYGCYYEGAGSPQIRVRGPRSIVCLLLLAE